MDNASLYAELSTDPAGLGYAPFIATRDDGGLLLLLLDPAGPGAGPVPVYYRPKPELLLGLRPAIARLSTVSEVIQKKWDRRLAAIYAVDGLVLDGPTLADFAEAITDGIMTQPEVDALTSRVGNRVEVLAGAGAVVSIDQLSAVLNAHQGA